MNVNFADVYFTYARNLIETGLVNIECNGNKVSHELYATSFTIKPQLDVSIYSHKDTRAFPIQFAMAELCWILSGSDYLEPIMRWNKTMSKWSDNGISLWGAYGNRLHHQWPYLVNKLKKDNYTRQAVASIYTSYDIGSESKDIPCNCLLQFLFRNDMLNLIVTSRSSDFFTGLPIDAFHWQYILRSLSNELNVKSNFLMYQIGSLHVYESDKDILEAMNVYYTGYTHFLNVSLKLFDVIQECEKHFTKAETLKDLSNILNLDYTIVEFLHNIFLERKYKIKR